MEIGYPGVSSSMSMLWVVHCVAKEDRRVSRIRIWISGCSSPMSMLWMIYCTAKEER